MKIYNVYLWKATTTYDGISMEHSGQLSGVLNTSPLSCRDTDQEICDSLDSTIEHIRGAAKDHATNSRIATERAKYRDTPDDWRPDVKVKLEQLTLIASVTDQQIALDDSQAREL